MTDQSPITREEMIEMFGDAIPMEAVALLWGTPDNATIGEVRAKLREIAAAKSSPPGLIERLRSESVNWSASCGELFGEAADEIDRLRERCAAYKGQVEAGAGEIARLRAILRDSRDHVPWDVLKRIDAALGSHQ